MSISHNNLDNLPPVIGWEDKTKEFSSFLERNYDTIVGRISVNEKVDIDVLHNAIQYIYRRLKHTEYELDYTANMIGFIYKTYRFQLKVHLSDYFKQNRSDLTIDIEAYSIYKDSIEEDWHNKLAKLHLAVKDVIKKHSMKKEHIEIFHRYFFEKKTFPIIAKEMNLSYGYVKGTYSATCVKVAKLIKSDTIK